MSQDNPGPVNPLQNFEQIDADAVCQQCDRINDEGTLICKACGNNLRDQRNLRIAQGAGPELMKEGGSKFRLFTGLLVTLGILLAVYMVLNIGNIEQALVNSLSDACISSISSEISTVNIIYKTQLKIILLNLTRT